MEMDIKENTKAKDGAMEVITMEGNIEMEDINMEADRNMGALNMEE